MKQIGLLSDTHAYWDDRYLQHFADCNEVWHAGDIGSMQIIRQLQKAKPFKGVYGNADGQEVRLCCPKDWRFTLEGVDVWITHIGGYPGRYAPEVRSRLLQNPPKLFICGHSHILKAQNDPQLQLLHLNPGAAGKQGWQSVRTLMRFQLEAGNIQNLEVIELK